MEVLMSEWMIICLNRLLSINCWVFLLSMGESDAAFASFLTQWVHIQFHSASQHLTDAAFASFLTQWVHIQFDSASLHLTDAAFAASPKKEQVLSESKLSLEPVPFLVYVDSLLTHKKSTIPVVALQKRYPQMRDQGLEPWTPWLRVRCSSNWANRA